MHQPSEHFCLREIHYLSLAHAKEKYIMPRVSITLPKDLYEKVTAIAGDNDESISYTIAKMTELGLLVTENQKKKEGEKPLSDIEAHCFKLMIQMNAIIKNLAAKQLEYNQDEFDKLRDLSVTKFNELMGILPDEL